MIEWLIAALRAEQLQAASEVEITAEKTIPEHETVVRLPARMSPFLMEVCDGDGAAGVRPVSWGDPPPVKACVPRLLRR